MSDNVLGAHPATAEEEEVLLRQVLLRKLEESGPYTGAGFAFLRNRYGDPPWWANADRWLKLDEAKRREWSFYDRITAALSSIVARWGA